MHTCLWSYNVLLATYYPEEERDRERRPASDQLSRGVAGALLHWFCPPLSPLAHWVEGECPVEGDDGDGWLGREGGVCREGHNVSLLRAGDQRKEQGTLDWRGWEGYMYVLCRACIMVLLLLLESQVINRNTFSNQISNQVIKRNAFTVFIGLKDSHALCMC